MGKENHMWLSGPKPLSKEYPVQRHRQKLVQYVRQKFGEDSEQLEQSTRETPSQSNQRIYRRRIRRRTQ